MNLYVTGMIYAYDVELKTNNDVGVTKFLSKLKPANSKGTIHALVNCHRKHPNIKKSAWNWNYV